MMKPDEMEATRTIAKEAYRNALIRNIDTKLSYRTGVSAFATLILASHRIDDMYHCARLLEKAECFGVTKPEQQWKRACALYEKILLALEKKEGLDIALYERSCYRLCQIALRIVDVTDSAAEERSIFLAPHRRTKHKIADSFQTALYWLRRFQALAALPAAVEHKKELRSVRTYWYAPQDWYYLWGRMYDVSGQQNYMAPAKAFLQAARYYTYAQYLAQCDHRPISRALMQAMLTVHTRLRQLDMYQALYDEATQGGQVPPGFLYICRMRQALIQEEYATVYEEMERYVQKNRPLPGFSMRRARAFMTLASQGRYKQTELPFYDV